MASKDQARRSKRGILHDDMEDDLSVKIPRFEELEEEDKKASSLSPSMGSIGARRESRMGQEKPAELFRKDLISAMKLADTEQLQPDDYVFISDPWRQDWERGVQVPVNPGETLHRQITVSKVLGNEKLHGSYAFKFPKKFLHAVSDENYKQGTHELHETQKLAEQVCRYDLDDTDVVWLNRYNVERQNMGQDPVLEWTMEHVIEEIESQCYNNMQNMIKTVEGLGIEYDENVTCDVCRSPEGEDNNEIVFCDGCDICVHQACYGIQKIPEGSWLCRTCALGIQPKCILCPKTGGAMKSTKSGTKWAHVSCALWIPEVSIGNPEKMEPVTKISQIPSSRWSLICNICRDRNGACIQCNVKTCKTAFHVTCAFGDNLSMKTVLDEAHDDVQLKAYCSKHSRRSFRDVDGTPRKEPATPTKRDNILLREPVTPMKKESEMTEEEKTELRSSRLAKLAEEFYCCVETSEVADALKMDDETMDFFIHYWVLKRKANFNKPLLMPKTEEADILLKQREDSLLARMKMFIHLRQDLERVRNLCYMLGRREKIRRSLYATKEEIVMFQLSIVDNMDRNSHSETRDWKFISSAHREPQTIYDQYDEILRKAQIVDAVAQREAKEQSEEPKPSTSEQEQANNKKPGRGKRRLALKEASRAKRALLASKVDKSLDDSSDEGEGVIDVMKCDSDTGRDTTHHRVPPIKLLARQLDLRNEVDFEEMKPSRNSTKSGGKKMRKSESSDLRNEAEFEETKPSRNSTNSGGKKTRKSEYSDLRNEAEFEEMKPSRNSTNSGGKKTRKSESSDLRNEVVFEEMKPSRNSTNSDGKKTRKSESNDLSNEVDFEETKPSQNLTNSGGKRTRKSESNDNVQAKDVNSQNDTFLSEAEEGEVTYFSLRRSTRQKNNPPLDPPNVEKSPIVSGDFQPEITQSSGLTIKIRTKDASGGEVSQSNTSASQGNIRPQGKLKEPGDVEDSGHTQNTGDSVDKRKTMDHVDKEHSKIGGHKSDTMDIDNAIDHSASDAVHVGVNLETEPTNESSEGSAKDKAPFSDTSYCDDDVVGLVSEVPKCEESEDAAAKEEEKQTTEDCEEKRQSNESRSSSPNSDVRTDQSQVTEQSVPSPKKVQSGDDSPVKPSDIKSADINEKRTARESSSPKKTRSSDAKSKRKSGDSARKLGGNGTALPRVEVSVDVDDVKGRIFLRVRNTYNPKSDSEESTHDMSSDNTMLDCKRSERLLHRQSLDSALAESKSAAKDARKTARRSSSRLQSLGINGLVSPSQLVIGQDIKDKVHSRLGRLRNRHVTNASLQNGVIDSTQRKMERILSRRKSLSTPSDCGDIVVDTHVMAKENNPENTPLLAKFRPIHIDLPSPERTKKSVLASPVDLDELSSGRSTPVTRSGRSTPLTRSGHHKVQSDAELQDLDGELSVRSSQDTSPERELSKYTHRSSRSLPLTRLSIERTLSNRLTRSRSSSITVTDSEGDVNLLQLPDSDSEYAPSDNSDSSYARHTRRSNSRVIAHEEESRDSNSSSVRSSSRLHRNSWSKFSSLQS